MPDLKEGMCARLLPIGASEMNMMDDGSFFYNKATKYNQVVI